MKKQLQSMRAIFRHFGEPVVGEPVISKRDGDKPGNEFSGIYDMPDLAGTLGSIEIDARARTLFCLESDTAHLKRDDILIVRYERFSLLAKHPDGTGFTLLVITPE